MKKYDQLFCKFAECSIRVSENNTHCVLHYYIYRIFFKTAFKQNHLEMCYIDYRAARITFMMI